MTKKEIRKWVVDNIARLNCYPLGDIVNDAKAWDKSQQNKGGIIILTRLLKELDVETRKQN
jgi:hypothetical protein